MKIKMHKKYKVLIVSFMLCLCMSGGAFSQVDSDLIDMKFKDADLVDVIDILSRQSNMNIVAGSDVSGKVTFDLRGVTVHEALEAALKINGYGYEKIGGIYFIKPVSQIVKEEAISPPPQPPVLYLRSYKLNYTDAAEVLSVLKENISQYGKANINKSNNIVVVEDTKEQMEKIETILKSIDVIPRQVMIEAKILEIRLGNDMQLGVDWSQVFKSGEATFNLEGANFSLPPSAGTPGLFFSVVTPHFNMFLDTLQQKGDLKTLATPKLVAIDNKEAEIIIGGRLGYRVTSTINQVTTESVEFLDIGTMLKITPRIGDDGNIFLSLYPKVSDGVITQGLPSETTTEVTTKVVVKDGESIFIGGLIRDRKEKSINQIPILGNIPLIGSFFRRSSDSLSKTETVIVITPQVIDARSAWITQREKDKIDSIEFEQIEQQ